MKRAVGGIYDHVVTFRCTKGTMSTELLQFVIDTKDN